MVHFLLLEPINALHVQQVSQPNQVLQVVRHALPAKLVLLAVHAQRVLQINSRLPVALAHHVLPAKQVHLVESATLVLKVKPRYQEEDALLVLRESLLVQEVFAAIAKQAKPRLPVNAQSARQDTPRSPEETVHHGLSLLISAQLARRPLLEMHNARHVQQDTRRILEATALRATR